MRNKARLEDGSAETTTTANESGEPEAFDPTLHAIRAVVADEDAQQNQASNTMQSTTDEADAPKWDAPANTPEFASQLKKLAKWLVGAGLSFLKRPDAPRLLSILFLLALIILKPGFVLFLFLMFVLVGLVLYFSFGPDQVESFAIERFRRLRERDSDAAEKLRHRAAKASKTLSMIVDRLPDKWTAGLHLPDFEYPPELPEKMKSDPFDRLIGQ